MSEVDVSNQPPAAPVHVAIVMDGNGRWAQSQGQPRIFGHRKGVESVRNVIDVCGSYNIPYLTLYAFSSENWNRPKEEIKLLIDLLVTTLEAEAAELHENGIKLNVVGDLLPFGSRIYKAIDKIKILTKDNNKLILTIAINYGGRWDLVRACKIIAQHAVDSDDFAIEELSEKSFARYLSTSDIPDPDLFIRTGGEIRLSNFLLWEAAYSELYFTEILWPDFDHESFKEALLSYQNRRRRFGKV